MPLHDAKAMLFIDDRQSQVVEFHPLLNESVRTDRDAGLAAPDALERRALFLGRHAALQNVDRVLERRQKPAEIEVVLLGQDLRRGHDRGLKSVFHRNDGGLGRNDGFPRSHIALKQTTHGTRRAHVVRNFLENALLGFRRMEWKDLFDRPPDLIPQASFRSLSARLRAVAHEADADLNLKQLFEDHALVSRR